MALRRALLVAVVGVAAAVQGCAPSPSPPPSPIRATLGAPWWVDGKLNWPPNDGCADPEKPETLPPGTKVDRYGSETGSYFAQPGTPYAARALPYDPAKMAYTIYVVQKPLVVEECTIAAWFGEPGGGEQFKAAEPAAQLKAEGAITPQ